jgi:hypothetical protein
MGRHAHGELTDARVKEVRSAVTAAWTPRAKPARFLGASRYSLLRRRGAGGRHGLGGWHLEC